MTYILYWMHITQHRQKRMKLTKEEKISTYTETDTQQMNWIERDQLQKQQTKAKQTINWLLHPNLHWNNVNL